MPRVGPGDDNVTGDRYTLDLGVEPDLGNLLQNSYAAIASSTMGMANVGMGMPMSMGMGGYAPFMPGQMSFAGMQGSAAGNIVQTMPSRVVEDRNISGYDMGGQSTVGPPR